jgi:hypothetical protein
MRDVRRAELVAASVSPHTQDGEGGKQRGAGSGPRL